MVDSVRGVLRVRKWPKKRGPPRSAAQAFWVDWFRQANLLAKYADGMSQARAIAMTVGSGMYPRDVLLKAMRGRLYTWVDETGWRWYSVAAIQDISESLDVLAQTVGSILVRAADRWRAPAAGLVGDVLTYQTLPDPPRWLAPPSAGGITQEALAGTPIVPDGTVALYDFDVAAYASISFVLDAVGFATSDKPVWRFSVDGGATYKAAAADYRHMVIDHVGSAIVDRTQIDYGIISTTAARRATNDFRNLRAGRASWQGGGESTSSRVRFMNGFANFAGPITDIRLLSSAGSLFNKGTIYVVGEK